MKEVRDVLAAIPGFADAKVVSRLSDGPTNQSYEILNGSDRYVLRLDRAEAARLGLDRRSEREVVESVARAGMAPEPAWYSPAGDAYLRPWVEGRPWSLDDLRSPKNIERLAVLLRRLHTLPRAGRHFDPLEAASRYAREIGTFESARCLVKAVEAFEDLDPEKATLCHNDLVCANIVEGNCLVLIDWEYAGMGDPFFDLAVVAQHHGLPGSLARHFVEAYLERAPSPDEWCRFEKQCRFYGALLELWTLRTGGVNPAVR